MKNQFIKFLLAGGLAAAANFGSRFFFSLVVPFVVAVGLAFMVGLVTGFVIMRAVVFKNATGATSRQASYYVLVNLVGLVVTVVVSVIVAKGAALIMTNLSAAEAIGHLAGIAAPVVLSYYAHRKITFR